MANNGHGWCGGHPYKKKSLVDMLELHESYGEGGANLLIVDTAVFASVRGGFKPRLPT